MQQTAKIASYITIILFLTTIVGYIIGYTKTFVKKQDLMTLEKKVNDINNQCKNLSSIYKIRNFQERV
jgi:cell division protein FtsL